MAGRGERYRTTQGQGRKSRGRKRNRRESPQLAPVSGVPRSPRSLPRGPRLGRARLLAEDLQDLALVVRRQAAEAARDLVLLVDPLANLRGVVAQLFGGLQNLRVEVGRRLGGGRLRRRGPLRRRRGRSLPRRLGLFRLPRGGPPP